jgi:hypothetical protein
MLNVDTDEDYQDDAADSFSPPCSIILSIFGFSRRCVFCRARGEEAATPTEHQNHENHQPTPIQTPKSIQKPAAAATTRTKRTRNNKQEAINDKRQTTNNNHFHHHHHQEEEQALQEEQEEQQEQQELPQLPQLPQLKQKDIYIYSCVYAFEETKNQ